MSGEEPGKTTAQVETQPDLALLGQVAMDDAENTAVNSAANETAEIIFSVIGEEMMTPEDWKLLLKQYDFKGVNIAVVRSSGVVNALNKEILIGAKATVNSGSIDNSLGLRLQEIQEGTVVILDDSKEIEQTLVKIKESEKDLKIIIICKEGSPRIQTLKKNSLVKVILIEQVGAKSLLEAVKCAIM